MATTAKQTSSSSVRGSSPASSSPTSTIKKTSSSSSSLIDVRGSSVGPGSVGGEEDIEKIAKQISDHAEAIYQTWKARGLAPTEILNCHSVNSDAFGKTLTPPRNRESPVNEILAQSPTMSNNNLKKLVNSFVSEDKARQQSQTVAARKTNILTSGTIRDALRKFESVDNSQTNVKPNFIRYSNSSSGGSSGGGGGGGGVGGISSTTTTKSTTMVVRQTSPQPTQTRQASPQPMPVVAQQQPLQSPQVLSQASQVLAAQSQQKQQSQTNSYGNQLNKNVPDVLINTISTIDKVKLTAGASDSPAPARVKPETPAKPASLLNHQPAWPLKNRSDRSVIENGGPKSATIVQTIKSTGVTNNSGSAGGHDTVKSSIKKTDSKIKTTNLLDEVLMEEERLINALKTGTVLNNSDKGLPEVITSTLSPTVKIAAPWSADRDDALVKPSTMNNINNNNNTTNNNTNSSSQNHSEIDGSQVKFTMKPRHKNEAAVPHPEVHTSTGKTNGTLNPRTASTAPAVRPFLTRGSVAERVLMFEKRPEVKAISNTPKEPNKLTVSFHEFSIPSIFYYTFSFVCFTYSISNFIHTSHQITSETH